MLMIGFVSFWKVRVFRRLIRELLKVVYCQLIEKCPLLGVKFPKSKMSVLCLLMIS